MLESVADGLWMIRGRRADPNVFIADGVLFDSVPRWSRDRLLAELDGQKLRAHVLTHVHPPTQGASRAVAEKFGAETYCGAGDLRALTTGDFAYTLPDRALSRLLTPILKGPVVSDATPLREGDTIGGFTVLEVPGHSPGHLAFWREADRLLLVGDVVVNRGLWAGRKGLQQPPPLLTLDPAQNRRSAKRLADLQPKTICFAHGEPERSGSRFVDYALSLPD